MTDTLLNEARRIAEDAHAGQVDKAGAPYIGHPVRVSSKCESEAAKVAALLHDVVEDTTVSLKDLKNAGFSEDVIEAVETLTHKKNDDYLAVYIPRIGRNAIAREVKIRDLEDNLDITRLSGVSDRDIQRLNKYIKAYHYLKCL